MSGIGFHQTKMGQDFYQGLMPKFLDELGKINKNLENINKTIKLKGILKEEDEVAINMSLRYDAMQGCIANPQKVRVRNLDTAILIEFEGYETEYDPSSERVLLEIADGELRAVVWHNPYDEEPTIIPIKKAES